MTITRFVCQAGEKIDSICAMLHRHGSLPKADTKSLALKLGIPYTTLTSAIRNERFSTEVEEKLASACGFDHQHGSWVDDSVPEWKRREKAYAGRDTAANFRAHLAERWTGGPANFRTERSEFKAFDPHMAKHHLSDAGQATPAGMAMQLFLAAHFQPFHHRSGIAFGFRKAALVVEIPLGNARASERLGHPNAAVLGDATIQGEAESPLQRWVIEHSAGESAILAGEYATTDQPLMSLAGCENGISLTSSIDVNIFDRTSLVSEGELDLSVNKQELIEQIFLRELPAAEERAGWITVSREKIVIARYGR
ncbi:MAG: hypothetical protein QOC65_1092 [Sphingomonadales bacterium]|nr:hypothetical protein [Sphingomonadales bacterium]